MNRQAFETGVFAWVAIASRHGRKEWLVKEESVREEAPQKLWRLVGESFNDGKEVLGERRIRLHHGEEAPTTGS